MAQRLGPDLRQQLQEGLEQIDQRLKVRGLRSWGQIYYFLYLRKLAQKAAFLEFFSKILAIVSSGIIESVFLMEEFQKAKEDMSTRMRM